jgi:hypothetical protein
MHRSQPENSHIVLSLLKSVEDDGNRSQRVWASEFGVALGLVNSYLKYCVRKGYIKMKRVPAQRYIYLLTPKGLAEKSRLTVELLSSSLAFFRQARGDCAEALKSAKTRGWKRLVLLGASELAEICIICALEANISVIAVVDAEFLGERFLGLPVTDDFMTAGGFDGIIVTDRFAPKETFDAAVAAYGADLVIAPSLLGISSRALQVDA